MLFLVLVFAIIGRSFSQESDAGLPGAFLRMGGGSRAVAMGRAFTAVANDASATYWNPAGLASLVDPEMIGMYTSLSMDRRYNYVAFSLPVRSLGTIGLSYTSLGVDNIEGRNLFGRVTDSFSNSESAYFVSWGFPLSDFLHLGGTVKYITHSLENRQSTGFGLDAGLMFKAWDFLQFGVMIQDISTRVKWDTESGLHENFPFTTRLGAAFKPSSFPIIIGMDLERVKDRDVRLHTGLDFNVISGFSLQVGYDNGRINFGSSITVPLRVGHFQTCYSLGEDPIDKSYVHGVSLRFIFSPPESYDYDSNRLKTEEVDGYLRLILPAPDARIIKVVENYPNYALINTGFLEDVSEGLIYGIYRLEVEVNGNGESDVKVLIGTAKVVKVEEDVSAVRVVWMKEGYSIRSGDVLMRAESNN